MGTPKKVTFDVTRVALSTASSVADGKIKTAAAFTKFLNENLKMKIESSLLEQRQSPNVPDLGPNLASEATDSAKDGKEIWAQMQEVVEEINSEK